MQCGSTEPHVPRVPHHRWSWHLLRSMTTTLPHGFAMNFLVDQTGEVVANTFSRLWSSDHHPRDQRGLQGWRWRPCCQARQLCRQLRQPRRRAEARELVGLSRSRRSSFMRSEKSPASCLRRALSVLSFVKFTTLVIGFPPLDGSAPGGNTDARDSRMPTESIGYADLFTAFDISKLGHCKLSS